MIQVKLMSNQNEIKTPRPSRWNQFGFNFQNTARSYFSKSASPFINTTDENCLKKEVENLKPKSLSLTTRNTKSCNQGAGAGNEVKASSPKISVWQGATVPTTNSKGDAVPSNFVTGSVWKSSDSVKKNNTSPMLDGISIASSISAEYIDASTENDIKSIAFNDDIQILERVKMTDTKSFVPNIQYGKVLKILSGSEFILAARIYNGYTKVLAPQIYHFHIRLRDIPFFGIYENCAKLELSSLLLDRIVIVKYCVQANDGFIEADIYNIDVSDLQNKNDHSMIILHNSYMCINDCMIKYADVIQRTRK